MDLFEAITAGDEERVKELLGDRPELAGTRSAEGLSPVLHALYTGHEGFVQPLLDANPPLDVFDAAAVGRTRGLEELLEADDEAARSWSADGFTPLHLAAYFGQAEAVRALLERGAKVDAVARNPLGVQPLNSAAASPAADARTEIASALLEAGADPNHELPDGFRPIDAAEQNEDDELAALLREHGATPSRRA